MKPSQTKILISGYHGFGNCGDEAILLAMKRNIEALDDVSLCALSFNPKETEKLYGIKCINRFRPLDVIRAIRGADVLIEGGGSLLQDETSRRSLYYYLTLIVVAKLFGKKVMLYSNGIGPIKHRFSENLIRAVVGKVDMITLREGASAALLGRMGIDPGKIHVTADPAFTLTGADDETVNAIFAKEQIPLDKPIVAVSVRKWQDNSFINNMAEICDYIIETHDANIVFIPMQLSADTKLSNVVKNRMKCGAYILRGDYTSDDILGVIGKAHAVLSIRLHTLIFAAAGNVPMLGFSYDPKVADFLHIVGAPGLPSLSGSDVNAAKKIVDDLFMQNDEIRAQLAVRTDMLKEKAKENDDYLKALLER